MAAKAKRKASRPTAMQVNATVKEITPKRHIDWFERAKSLAVMAVAITSLGTLWAFGQGILTSGPLPVPSRAEVAIVAKTLETIVEKQQMVNQQVSNQLNDQHDITQMLIAQQKQELAASRSRQLRNLQLILEQAKATLSKDQTLANQTAVDTLTAQMEGLQVDIMREAVK